MIRTRIGSPYVIEGMGQLSEKVASVAGFEANGGFLAGTGIALDDKALEALPTRDAVLPVLAVLAAAKARHAPVSSLLADLPARFTASDRLQNIPTAKTQQLLERWTQDFQPLCVLLGVPADQPITLNTTDGLRITFGNGEIIHLRGSGNAPELRCYSEATTPGRAQFMMRTVLAGIASELS